MLKAQGALYQALCLQVQPEVAQMLQDRALMSLTKDCSTDSAWARACLRAVLQIARTSAWGLPI